MNNVADQILKHLRPLIGLKLSVARRAADMRNFLFGVIRQVENGTVGEYGLHIQCPWRIDGPEGIVTGRMDLYEPVETGDDFDWESWDYEKSENMQDHQIANLLGGYDPQTNSHVNETKHLVVEDVQADDFGGATIMLSGGYRLILFPAGTQSENWRIFRPSIKGSQPHFVISGGRIEDEGVE